MLNIFWHFLWGGTVKMAGFLLSVRWSSSADFSESLKPSVCRCYLRSACWHVLGEWSEVVSRSQTSLVLNHHPCNLVSTVCSALVTGRCLLSHTVHLTSRLLLHTNRSSLHRNALHIFEPRVLFQGNICACFVLRSICKRIWIIWSLWSNALSLSVSRNNLLPNVLLAFFPVVKVLARRSLHCIPFGFLWHGFLFLCYNLLQLCCTSFLLYYPVVLTIGFILVLGH